MKNTIQDILIFCILVLFGFMYGAADYTGGYPAPDYLLDKIWYIGEALIYFLFSIFGVYSNNNFNYRTAWKILAGFFLIRLTWETSAMIQGVSVWEKIAMAAMYLATAVVIFFITYLPYITRIWQRLK